MADINPTTTSNDQVVILQGEASSKKNLVKVIMYPLRGDAIELHGFYTLDGDDSTIRGTSKILKEPVVVFIVDKYGELVQVQRSCAGGDGFAGAVHALVEEEGAAGWVAALGGGSLSKGWFVGSFLLQPAIAGIHPSSSFLTTTALSRIPRTLYFTATTSLYNTGITLTTFTCFPDLPTELRLIIWRLTLPSTLRTITFVPRVIGSCLFPEQYLDWYTGSCDHFRLWNPVVDHGPVVPVAALVNRESRDVLLERFTVFTCPWDAFALDPTPMHPKRGLYIDYAMDRAGIETVLDVEGAIYFLFGY